MVSGSDPKLHHFLPQMLLRRFTDNEGRLAYFTRLAPKNGVISGKPKSLFAENHLYTVESSDGSREVELEKSLSVLEGKTEPILAKIISSARSGNEPGLSAEEKSVLDSFFCMQWKRVPDVHSKSLTLRNADAHIDKAIADLTAKHPKSAAELEALRSPEEKARLAQAVKVRAIGTDVGKISALLDQRGLVVARASEGLFVIGSSPIVRNGNDLRAPNGQAWLPIASDVAIGPGNAKGSETLIDLPSDRVGDFNLIAAKQSTSFAAASHSLVEHLAKALGLYLESDQSGK